MRWAAAVQRELLKVDWPDGVLEWAECSPETDEDGQLLWRGLRVKVGMAVGHDAGEAPAQYGCAENPPTKGKIPGRVDDISFCLLLKQNCRPS